MNALVPAAIPAENVLSDRFRVHAVMGDGMAPTFRGGRDYALLAPVTTYVGEGVYALDVGPVLDLFRVMSALDGKGSLLLFRDNKRYENHTVSREQFEAAVVAYMVAEIKVKDERFLREARQ